MEEVLNKGPNLNALILYLDIIDVIKLSLLNKSCNKLINTKGFHIYEKLLNIDFPFINLVKILLSQHYYLHKYICNENNMIINLLCGNINFIVHGFIQLFANIDYENLTTVVTLNDSLLQNITDKGTKEENIMAYYIAEYLEGYGHNCDIAIDCGSLALNKQHNISEFFIRKFW
jgi:hypothetical protein